MPEYRDDTPSDLRDLESFLWWDFAEVATWSAWMKGHGFPEADASKCFKAAVELQGKLRALQAYNNGLAEDDGTMAWLNRALPRHDLRPRMDKAYAVQFGRADDPDPLTRVLQLVLGAIIRGQWRRFKLCRDQACRASYFDSSRNASMTWCSMKTCGSRNKMRRYRAQAE